jgi:hypothetical protein
MASRPFLERLQAVNAVGMLMAHDNALDRLSGYLANTLQEATTQRRGFSGTIILPFSGFQAWRPLH